MLRRKSKPKLLLTEIERDAMRAAGRFNAELMDFIRPYVLPGVRTEKLNRLVHQYTLDHGHTPACLGYLGFPKSCCISMNDVVCHGIPGKQVLQEGDIVNIDLTTIVDGWYGDQSETFFVGGVSETARQVTQCSFDAMHLGIEAIRPGGKIADIGRAIVAEAAKYRFGVVKDYVGHGIGRTFHQDPSVPHYPTPLGERIRIEPGMTFTVEPMINAGSGGTLPPDRADGWTVRTQDGSISAQFEHTVLVTEKGPEILTLTQHGPQRGHRF